MSTEQAAGTAQVTGTGQPDGPEQVGGTAQPTGPEQVGATAQPGIQERVGGITQTGSDGPVQYVDPWPQPPARQQDRSVRLDRIVLGLLLAVAGVGWMLDEAGVSVPWRLFPALALAVIGGALLVSLVAGRGRGALVGLGVVALIAGVTVGVGADRYAGPVGDQVLTPAVADWPVTAKLGAGTLTVDLTGHPLPVTGDLRADVGAGKVILVLPESSRIAIDARTTAGTVTVDGDRVGDGLDVRWSQPATAQAGATSITVELQVGLGDIEVRHG